MELRETVLKRRTIRKFLSRTVPQKEIEEIMNDASWSPSWGNTQPYEIYVSTGRVTETIKKRNLEAFQTGIQSNTDVPTPVKWPELLKSRYVDVGRRVLTAQSIKREDQERRVEYYQNMFTLFDAPVFVVFVVDEALNLEYSMLDIGLITQTVCLLAQERGLGSCVLASSVTYPEIIREAMGIPDSRKIVIGLGLGYPDLNDPINTFERKRAPLDEIVRWVD